MRILKWILGFVAVAALVFIVGAFFLPREVTVARSLDINAPADKIFPHVNSMSAMGAWSPWTERDPNMDVTIEGPSEGVGNKLIWASEVQGVGNGTQIITASEANKLVATDLDFGEMGTAKAKILLEQSGEVTNVTWGFTSDMGNNPIGRWMGLMMDGWVGGDYEKGLANLKTLVEES